ncbi:aspartate kinase [Saccharicrinis aurantiacus]|uniref:aspartate kinase n=1 Tax=Saccharicrinis aurantiacus TaxID=1849719 RepID=UPI0008386048|nr:aspartate kinase [Saccharicrinis aurantiacus]
MITISQAVESIIKVKPFIAEALSEGLINVSALARKIKPDIEKVIHKECNQGAIVMALNRLSPNLANSFSSDLKKMINMLGDIIVRSDLTDYTYTNSNTLVKGHMKVFETVASHSDIFYTMVRGVHESNLVISSLYSNLVEEHFKGEELKEKKVNLSAITLKLHESNSQVPGFYYNILKAVAWEGINIIEVISTSNEFTILVNDEDVDRAFSELKQLRRKL